MEVAFYSDTHTYKSVDLFSQVEWKSFSKIPSEFLEKFDSDLSALKSSQNSKSKWYNLSPEYIKETWNKERERSVSLGNWYHTKQEQSILCEPTYKVFLGKELPVFPPNWVDGVKYATSQKLVDGVYPEFLAYLKSAAICGQIDNLFVVDNVVYIEDYKTSKDLMKPPYVNFRGEMKRFLPPLFHLGECDLNKYTLQLSLAMYTVLRHNPQLKAGKMWLRQVIFESEGEDQFGYPIYREDGVGGWIVKEENRVEVPYMKREVELMIEALKRKKETHV